MVRACALCHAELKPCWMMEAIAPLAVTVWGLCIFSSDLIMLMAAFLNLAAGDCPLNMDVDLEPNDEKMTAHSISGRWLA